MHLIWNIAVLAALLCACVPVTLAQPIPYFPVVSYITPNSGSLAGGTDIVIFGSGFARNGVEGRCVRLVCMQVSFLHTCTASHHRTTVFVGTKECVVNEYRSSDTKVVHMFCLLSCMILTPLLPFSLCAVRPLSPATHPSLSKLPSRPSILTYMPPALATASSLTALLARPIWHGFLVAPPSDAHCG